MARGDNAFGNNALMRELEARGQGFMFKLKLTKNVKRHVPKLFTPSGWTRGRVGRGRTENWRGQAGNANAASWWGVPSKRRSQWKGDARSSGCCLSSKPEACAAKRSQATNMRCR
jgi:hypothetical protein